MIDSPTCGKFYSDKGTTKLSRKIYSANVAGKMGQSIEKQSKTKQTKP